MTPILLSPIYPARPMTGHSKVSTARKSKVFIIDDHPAICDALTYTLNDTDDISVCGHSGSAVEALQLIGKTRPSVAVVDISLEDSHGLDLVQSIRSLYPEVQVVVFSMYDESVYAERAIRAGAVGYLMKSESTASVLQAIRSAVRGEIYLSQTTSSRILQKLFKGKSQHSGYAIDELKDHEFAVFQMLGQGFTIAEIQDRLRLSRKTVETYRRHVKEKLGFETVGELLQFAVQWTYGQSKSRPLE